MGFYPARNILPHLWVGSMADAHDLYFLHSNGIRLVVNASKTISFSRSDGSSGALNYRVAVDDDVAENRAMYSHFPIVVRAIDNTLRNKQGVLVHCYAGIQRSCAVAAAYLMYKYGYSPSAAMRFIRSKKPEAFSPVPTFRWALDSYYTVL
jgi:protein-tyrosine phosphatase